jgi:predicted RNA-binding protein Jag
MEAYLARLSEELEILLGETGRMLEALQTAQAALTVRDNGEGGV